MRDLTSSSHSTFFRHTGHDAISQQQLREVFWLLLGEIRSKESVVFTNTLQLGEQLFSVRQVCHFHANYRRHIYLYTLRTCTKCLYTEITMLSIWPVCSNCLWPIYLGQALFTFVRMPVDAHRLFWDLITGNNV